MLVCAQDSFQHHSLILKDCLRRFNPGFEQFIQHIKSTPAELRNTFSTAAGKPRPHTVNGHEGTRLDKLRVCRVHNNCNTGGRVHYQVAVVVRQNWDGNDFDTCRTNPNNRFDLESNQSFTGWQRGQKC